MSFFTATDRGRMARELVDILQEANQEINEDLWELSASYGGGGKQKRGSTKKAST